PIEPNGAEPTLLSFHLPDGGQRLPGIDRLLNLRIYGGWWDAKSAIPVRALRRLGKALRPAAGKLKRSLLRRCPTGSGSPIPAKLADSAADTGPQLVPFPREGVFRPPLLHTNACGDFTLMAACHWWDIRGYPEFEIYSFNIDSLGCHMAHHAG